MGPLDLSRTLLRLRGVSCQLGKPIRRKLEIAASIFRNAVNFSSARKTKRFQSFAMRFSNPDCSPVGING